MEERAYNPRYYDRKELKDKCGVYQIRNLENNKIYVGSSKTLSNRWRNHMKDLRRNKHVNPHLQRAYNKVNGNFTFEVIEFCSEDEQYSLEQYWINKFIENSYNINPSAVKPPNCKGKKYPPRSEETRRKLSESLKRGYMEHPERREELSRSRIGKNMGKDHVNSKPVICLETGKEYEAINEAVRETGFDRHGISNCCLHKYYEIQGYHFLFKSEYEQMSEEDIKEYMFSKNRRIQVVCLETRELYEGIVRASEATGVPRDSIGRCCSGKAITGYGLHWVYYEKFKKMSEDEIEEVLKTTGDKRRRVMCITTGKIYETVAKAQQDLELSSGKVSDCCRGERRSTKGYQFMYYDEYLKMTDGERRNFLKKRVPKYKTRAILCVETGEVFESMREAAQSVNTGSDSIYKCCRGLVHTIKGFHWKYAD